FILTSGNRPAGGNIFREGIGIFVLRDNGSRDHMRRLESVLGPPLDEVGDTRRVAQADGRGFSKLEVEESGDLQFFRQLGNTGERLKAMILYNRIVSHLLKLGDRFQMERVVDLSKKHLESSSNLNVAKKLMLADQYRLTSLKDHCLQSFTSIADLTGKLKSSSEMAYNSNFVLRWEIDNATAKFASGNGESEVFHEGGFEWKIGLAKNKKDRKFVDFTITCRAQFLHWKHYGSKDKILVVVRGGIISSVMPPAPVIDLTKFSSPNEMNNVTLVIGDKKLRVCKDYLAVRSPVFASMFFGDFAEKEKEEVELKEVVYEEFIDVLQLIYLGNVKITDRTAPKILKLGGRFQMEATILIFCSQRVLDMLENHLKISSNLNDHCLESFTSVAELTEKLKPGCTDYSDSMAAAIYRHIKIMADSSNFILRWEVNNAAARIAMGNGLSKVFKEGGFEWKVGFNRNFIRNMKVLYITLACDLPGKKEWMCETDFEFIFGPSEFKRQNIFTHNKKAYVVYCIAEESLRTSTGYINMDKIVVEFRVKVLSSEPPIFDLSKFSSPNELSNVTLVIGDEKLRVCKDYLSIHSPFFAAMFFGDFAEKEKEEVELKEIIYEVIPCPSMFVGLNLLSMYEMNGNG
ncbi:hypothetical protein PRIPAC_84351, partial [Pristionchus pacificus]|uniref:BTB domain-containing protein n=1 Tax=Pristionchus pacificus TaxID=54126 RepID=A0A2A6CCP0_PRIPA